MFRNIAMLLIIIFIFLCPCFAGAEGFQFKDDTFDKDVKYKIYFTGSERDNNVIENVYILGFEEIAGRLFLVVRSKGFSITREKGYVLFDSISAILPDQNLKIHRIKRSVHTK